MAGHIARIGKNLLGKTERIQSSRNFWKIFKNEFGSYSKIVSPGVVSANGSIPASLATPDYYPHGKPSSPSTIEIKQPQQIEGMRRAAIIAREVMDTIGKNVQVGISTEELDQIAHSATISRDSYPSPLFYRGYPKSVCTSVNNVACHGIPDDRKLQKGDIISVDVTVFHGGYHGDCCETWCLPGTDEPGLQLVAAAREARDQAISVCGPGVPFATIGEVCEQVSHAAGVTVVPVFIGHGIGSYFHGPPDVYHFANNDREVMQAGMTFTVEPILTQGKEGVVILEDGWTAMMVDHGRAAQFEHTVLITPHGHDILTAYTDQSQGS